MDYPFGGVAANTFFSQCLNSRSELFVIAGASPRDHWKPFFKQYKILTLPCLFILESVTLIHRNLSLFPERQTGHLTRQRYTIPLPIPHSALVQRSIIYNSVKLYNHLPADVLSVSDVSQFRKQLKEILLQHAFYKVDEFLNLPF